MCPHTASKLQSEAVNPSISLQRIFWRLLFQKLFISGETGPAAPPLSFRCGEKGVAKFPALLDCLVAARDVIGRDRRFPHIGRIPFQVPRD